MNLPTQKKLLALLNQSTTELEAEGAFHPLAISNGEATFTKAKNMLASSIQTEEGNT